MNVATTEEGVFLGPETERENQFQTRLISSDDFEVVVYDTGSAPVDSEYPHVLLVEFINDGPSR